MSTPLLKVTGLRAGYGKAEVLHGIGIEAAKGGVITVIGPNGAGKSTMFRLITGQETPDAGTIRVGETVKLLQGLQALMV